MYKLASLAFLASSLFSFGANGECNWAAWSGLFPLATEYCSYITSPANQLSLSAECASDGESASVLEYDNDECSGNSFNETDSDLFQCDQSGSCDVITMELSYYIGSDDCSGDAEEEYDGALYFAELTNECLTFSSAYIGITTSEDGLFADVYDNDECDGTIYFSFNITSSCESGGGNSTLFNFVAGDSGGSGSGSGSAANKVQTYLVYTVATMVFVFVCSQL